MPVSHGSGIRQQTICLDVFVAVETFQPIFGWVFFSRNNFAPILHDPDITGVVQCGKFNCTKTVQESAVWQQARCPMLGRFSIH